MDSEKIVAAAYSEQPKVFKFMHAEQNDLLDKMGADFIVELPQYALTKPLQVKTSNNGETLGIVLPIPNFSPENFPKKIPYKKFKELVNKLPGRLQKKISFRMLQQIADHSRKHNNVDCMLFVARVGKRKSKEAVILEVRIETEMIFKILKSWESKKKIRH